MATIGSLAYSETEYDMPLPTCNAIEGLDPEGFSFDKSKSYKLRRTVSCSNLLDFKSGPHLGDNAHFATDTPHSCLTGRLPIYTVTYTNKSKGLKVQELKVQAAFAQKTASQQIKPLAAKNMKPESEEQGRFKKLIKRQNGLVQLKRIKQSSRYTDKKYFAIAAVLYEHPCCCPCIPVDKSMLVAKNGGECIADFCKKGTFHGRRLVPNTIKMASFINLTEFLEKLHDAGIILRDIKPENITISSDGKKLFFIDNDDAAVPTLNNYKSEVSDEGYTKPYVVQSLMGLRQQGDLAALIKLDLYALLITIIEMNSMHPNSLCFLTRDVREMPEKSILECQSDRQVIDKKLNQWVESCVNTAYRKQILDFISDPATNGLSEPLSKMLKIPFLES